MRVLACLVLCLAFSSGFADTPVRAPNCEPPERPNEDVRKYVWDQFLAAVDGYRVCISTYVERNQLASDSHRAAANQATLGWNEFVRTSLNAPKDYPWPANAGGAGVAPEKGAEKPPSQAEPSPPSE